MKSSVAQTLKWFLLKRLEWLIRGWFFAAGCWFIVFIAYLCAIAPEYASTLIDRLH